MYSNPKWGTFDRVDENIFVWKIFFEIRIRTHILWTALKFVTIASDFSATQPWAKILKAELQGIHQGLIFCSRFGLSNLCLRWLDPGFNCQDFRCLCSSLTLSDSLSLTNHTYTHNPYTHAQTHTQTHKQTHTPTPSPIHAYTHTHTPTHTHTHTHTHTFRTLVKHSKSLPGQSERIQCSNQVDLVVHYGLSWTNQTKNFRSLLNIIEDLVEEYKTNFNRHQNFRKSFIGSIFFTYDSFESSHLGICIEI